ncbi:MAG: archease [Pseudomonadota bacterium]
MKYRLTDHTADFGIQANGQTLAQVFENAAFALYDLITDTGILAGNQTISLTVTGDDQNDLMMNWLRELLYLWNGMGMLVKQASVRRISEFRLTADVAYDLYDSSRHEIRNEIKAVTYHQLEVGRNKEGWFADFILDV